MFCLAFKNKAIKPTKQPKKKKQTKKKPPPKKEDKTQERLACIWEWIKTKKWIINILITQWPLRGSLGTDK